MIPIPHMRAALRRPQMVDLRNVGIDEAPGMPDKAYIMPGGKRGNSLPVGGVDYDTRTPGQQIMPPAAMQPPGPPQPGAGTPQGMPPGTPAQMAPGAAGVGMPQLGQPAPPPGNLLQMTRPGMQMAAMQRMAGGGAVDYRGEHTAPGPDSGAPMHDVTRGVYPSDFYGPNGFRYYADNGDAARDRGSYNTIMNAKGKPEYKAMVYRAIPTAVYEKAMKSGAPSPQREMILPGDWVTTSRDYAHEHGQNALNGEYRIARMRVPARHLYTAGDSIHSIHEWGYCPDTNTQNLAKGGAISKAAHNPVTERPAHIPPVRSVDVMRVILSAKPKVK